MINHSLTAKGALGYALGRAATVVWGGLVALGMYYFFVTAAPTLEGQWAPVVTRYALTEVRQEDNGGFSYISNFYKERDCVNQGSSWYAPNEYGDLVRLTPRRLTGDPQPPQTGPIGWRVGERQALYPPEGATYVLGVLNSDCRWIWQTRTTLGPFALGEDGLPILQPDPRTGEPVALAGPVASPAAPLPKP